MAVVVRFDAVLERVAARGDDRFVGAGEAFNRGRELHGDAGLGVGEKLLNARGIVLEQIGRAHV